MHVLIVSDLHGNWPALRAIDEPADAVLCLGDLVDYGPYPAECVRWVRERAQTCVRGNHDHAVAQVVPACGLYGYRYLSGVTRPTSVARLDAEDRRWLGRLPTRATVVLGGKRLFLVHATPRDPMDEYGPPERSFWAERTANVDADFVLVGHTHTPFDLDLGRLRVVNPGSVGLPRDGDPRASYAVLDTETGAVTFRRVAYDVEEAVAAVEATPLPRLAKTMLAECLRTGKVETNAGPTRGHRAAVALPPVPVLV